MIHADLKKKQQKMTLSPVEFTLEKDWWQHISRKVVLLCSEQTSEHTVCK